MAAPVESVILRLNIDLRHSRKKSRGAMIVRSCAFMGPDSVGGVAKWRRGHRPLEAADYAREKVVSAAFVLIH